MDFQPMSPEEMQRAMQFLLDHHARIDARIDRMAEGIHELAGSVGRLDVKTELIADGLIGLTGIVGEVVRGVDVLRRAGEATDERLNIVVNMFERHLREDHGQRPS